jgi:hypothetical protein
MFIQIKLDEMVHLTERAFCNHNYYSYGNSDVVLYQYCDEEYDTYDYYLIQHGVKVFLGSASHDEEDISFLYQYT